MQLTDTPAQFIMMSDSEVYLFAMSLAALLFVVLLMLVFFVALPAYKSWVSNNLKMKRTNFYNAVGLESSKTANELNRTELDALQQATVNIQAILTAPFLELHRIRLQMAEMSAVLKTAEMFGVDPSGAKNITDTIPRDSLLVNLTAVYTEGDKLYSNRKLSLVIHRDKSISLYSGDGANLGFFNTDTVKLSEWLKTGAEGKTIEQLCSIVEK